MTKPKPSKRSVRIRKELTLAGYDGIHTCSKGCSKPGCTRTLRDTIEEQDHQIEALKRDILEKTAELRKSEEHNAALCERMQDLNGEVHTASCANANMHKENARLKAEVERLTAFTTRTIIPNEELQARVERLTKAGDAMASSIQFEETLNDSDHIPQSVQAWNAAKEGKGQP
jgi:uncharacterized coiled-coil DUF342 family protein